MPVGAVVAERDSRRDLRTDCGPQSGRHSHRRDCFAIDETSAVTSAGNRFRFEADMVAPVVALRAALTAGLADADNHVVLLEVPAFESIPDLVLAQLDQGAVQQRQAAGLDALDDLTAVRVLRALTSGVQHLDDLAGAVGVSRAHLRRTVLPALCVGGWVSPTPSRGVVVELIHPYRPLLNWAVTVEVKRTKWREAVAQARRHTHVADRAYVALDAAAANPAREWAPDLARERVGLITVDATSERARIERRPLSGRSAVRPCRDESARALFGERIWAMQVSGSVVGYTFPVFGRVLPPPALVLT